MSDPNVQCARVAIRDALGCTDDPEVRRYLDEALHLLDRIEDEKAAADELLSAEAAAERLLSDDAADWSDHLRN